MRIVIFCLIAGLMFSLGLLGMRLQRDVDALYTVDTNGMIWTVFQIETEFANLEKTLAISQGLAEPDSPNVRLRADIALSRVTLLQSVRSRSFWQENAEAADLLDALDDYSDAAASIIDRPESLTHADIGALFTLTDEIQPQVRRLAVLGVALGARASEARRDVYVRLLQRTALVAIALVGGLTVTLLYLDRLLANARRRDAELWTTARKLASTVASSLDGIVIANEDGDIVDYNAAAGEIFGWTREEILGRSMSRTLIAPDQREERAAEMAQFLATRDPRVVNASRVEMLAVRKSGAVFPIEINVTCAEQDRGNLFIAYVRDISERKISERKLIDARDRAERADRAKSQFLTIMSHEMRTPLNGILGVLDLLKTTRLDPRQERFVEVAGASGHILLEHVNDAIDITRIETDSMALTPQTFSLADLVCQVTEVLSPLAAEKGLTLETDIDPAMTRDFTADSGRIGQILTNLIGNAIKFTETGGIAVTVSGIHGPNGTEVMLSVADTGPGIAPDRLDEIFEDFVVVAPSGGRQSRGDGLGLAISRKIARLMEGDLVAESTLGEGSVFTLTLPLQHESDPSRATAPGAPRLTTKHVLIVEDNAINRSVLKEMLRGFGHAVSEAENGTEGVHAAERQSFDLIVMDFSMPVMDGVEATRRIRQGRGPNRKTYILGLTAHGGDEYRQEAVAAGMNGFCTKPLRLSALAATLAGIDLEAEVSAPTQPLSHDVLSDLKRTLGPDRTWDTAERFFGEIVDAVERWRDRNPGVERKPIADELHKLRGAAVLLGLNNLAGLIDEARAAIKDGACERFDDTLTALEAEVPVATAAIDALVHTAPKDQVTEPGE